MVKAVFFDVDGTLLSFKTHKVPESALQSLQQLKEKGMKIFVSSGRPHYLLDSLKNIEFDGYVTLNGSHSFIPGGETLLKKNISSDDIRSIIEWSRQVSYPLVFMHADGWFAPVITPEIREITDHLEVDLPEVLPIEEALGKDIVQIMGFCPGSLDWSVQENGVSGCTLSRWHGSFWDIEWEGKEKEEGIIRDMEQNGIEE